MATIKIRRGSGQPAIGGSGLTAYEPAWDTVNNRLFINNGSTAMWIGAAVIQDTTLSGNCTWTIPTQNSVKTYVDNQVAAGAVTSVNGATGAVTIGGGTGISILTSAAARGVTIFNAGVLSINGNTGAISNVAFTNIAQTFNALQSFSSGLSATTGIFTGILNPTAGISANGGMTLAGIANILGGVDMKSGLTVGGSAVFNSAASFQSGVTIQNGLDLTSGRLNVNAGICASGGMTLSGTSIIQGLLTVSENASFLKALNVTQLFSAAGGISAAGGLTIDSVYTRGNLSVDGSATLLGGFDAKGATFGNFVKFNAGLSASSINVSGGATFNGNIYAPNLVTSVDGVTGAVDLLAGSGISITLPTGAAKGITLANTGVLSIAGTSNQITASGSTGSVTLSLPSAITTPGSLTTTTSLLVGTDATITGNLTVNGTTTTVNSTTVTVQDPIIAIGGLTGNIPPTAGDVKDRGVVFQWNDGGTGKTGFFGHDTSTGFFTYIPNITSLSSEVVTGTPGTVNVNGIRSSSGTSLILQGVSSSNASITLTGSSIIGNQTVQIVGDTTIVNSGSAATLALRADPLDPSLNAYIQPTTITAARTFTLPDISGSVVVANTMGATSGWLLRGTGASTAPTWINPNASGFTAFTTTNLNLVAVKDAVNYGLVFALGTAGNQIPYADSTTGIMWRPSTNTLTVGAGLGYFEGIIEGGTF